MKRLMDYFFCIFVLLFLLWLLPLIAISIKLNSPGPVFFSQTRVGRNEKPFSCIKFRTMHVGTLNVGTHDVSSSSVTSIGRWLRATKVDELPQVWNLVRGEMSLIGPRPNLPSQQDVIEARRRHGVYQIMPGISGLAQIYKIDMSEPKALARFDALYLRHQNVCLDLFIAVKTLTGSGSGDRVRVPSLQGG